MVGQAEVSTAILNGSHAFLVIATDGVWEFLHSQTVVDLVSLSPWPPCPAYRNVIAGMLVYVKLLQ